MRNFELAAITTDFGDKRAVAAMLLQAIGKQGMRIFNHFGIDVKDIKSEEVKNKFDEYFKGRDFLRYKFFAGKQREGEAMEQVISRMEDLREQCQLQGIREDIIKNVIIQGVKDETFKGDLIKKKKLTLDGLKSAYAMYESADKMAK